MQQETNQQTDDGSEIDLGRIFFHSLHIVKRFWFLILLITVGFAAIAAVFQHMTYTPSYKAHYSISVKVINKATLSDTNSLYAVYYDQDLAKQLDSTFTYLLNSDFLSDDIKEHLGGKDPAGSVQAKSIEGSNIFVLTTYSSSPKNASTLLEAVMAVFADAAEYVVGDMEIEIIEGPVVPQSPYNPPNRTKAIAMGAFLGLALCIGLIVLYSIIRRTVFQPEELEEYLNMPCFGVVPIVQAKKNLSNALSSVSTTREQGFFRESIRGISRKIENSMKRKDAKVILITSTAPSEGKSMLSQNVAEMLAHWGNKVILFDGDLRKPNLFKRYGLKNERISLLQVLSGKEPARSIIRKKDNENLWLALNTIPLEKPTSLIDSTAMKDLITSFRSSADIVIIDTPPCSQFSDVYLYEQYADGIVYVVQQDRISINQIVNAAKSINNSENKLLGYVLNGAREVTQGYGKYGYGKYSYGKYGKYGKYGYGKDKYYGTYGENKN